LAVNSHTAILTSGGTSGASAAGTRSFTAYHPETEEQHKAKRLMLAWSEGKGKPWLFFCGNRGVGKTHLARAAVLALIGRDQQAHYTPATDMANLARSKSASGTFDEWMSWLEIVPNLVVDDLGREYPTDWTRSVFYQVIDKRYLNRKRTVFISNFKPTELVDVIDAPLVDRLMDAAAVRLCCAAAGAGAGRGGGRHCCGGAER
jgi:DNA replication protein DnaC